MPEHETNTGDSGGAAAALSRREFLKRASIGGGALVTAGGSIALKHVIDDHHKHELDETAAYNNGEFAREELAERDRDVKLGMRRYWKEAHVWPGLAIMPPDVQLFGTVMLEKGSEIAWPKGRESEHLAVQRPFMVLQTEEDDGFVPISGPGAQGDTPPRPGVMSFWMPDSQQIAFCDQQAFSSEILMPTNSDAPIYEGGTNYNGIVGEKVHLEPAVSRDGLTYRYLVNDVSTYFGNEVTTKVCGRSAWADLSDVATDYYAYEDGPRAGSDIVQLPGAP